MHITACLHTLLLRQRFIHPRNTIFGALERKIYHTFICSILESHYSDLFNLYIRQRPLQPTHPSCSSTSFFLLLYFHHILSLLQTTVLNKRASFGCCRSVHWMGTYTLFFCLFSLFDMFPFYTLTYFPPSTSINDEDGGWFFSKTADKTR